MTKITKIVYQAIGGVEVGSDELGWISVRKLYYSTVYNKSVLDFCMNRDIQFFEQWSKFSS